MDGIRDVAECGHGLLVVCVYESFHVSDRIRLGGNLLGCGEGYMGVALKGGGV
jgi:hypothetical protein